MTPRRFRTGYGIAMRWFAVVLATLQVGVFVLAYLDEGFSLWRAATALFWTALAVFGWRVWCRQTVVGPEGLRVWGQQWRIREIPNEEIVEVHRKTSFSPVRVDLTSGESLELPGVKPEDYDEVRTLLHR